FPACYLQWIAQLQRVERSARAASRRSSERRGRANRSCANFAMAGPWRRGDNAWAALRHATCHATRDEPCGSEVEGRSEEHTSELQSLTNLVCRLLLEKKNKPHKEPPCTIL